MHEEEYIKYAVRYLPNKDWAEFFFKDEYNPKGMLWICHSSTNIVNCIHFKHAMLFASIENAETAMSHVIQRGAATQGGKYVIVPVTIKVEY